MIFFHSLHLCATPPHPINRYERQNVNILPLFQSSFLDSSFLFSPLFIFLSFFLFIYLSIYLYIYLFIYLVTCICYFSHSNQNWSLTNLVRLSDGPRLAGKILHTLKETEHSTHRMFCVKGYLSLSTLSKEKQSLNPD